MLAEVMDLTIKNKKSPPTSQKGFFKPWYMRGLYFIALMCIVRMLGSMRQ
jgi:hypothetical protein